MSIAFTVMQRASVHGRMRGVGFRNLTISLTHVRLAARTQTRRHIQTSANTNAPEAYLEHLESRPGIAMLSLNRPKAKNAISVRLLKEMQECLDTVREDASTRVLILRSSTPNAFCAGADLAERRTMSLPQVDTFLLALRRALHTLSTLPVPTLAAIDGPALGGGLELALACDLRVAARSVTKIGLPEVKLGIIPGAGGTQRLARLVGVARAMDLVFTGRMVDASEAGRLGVVEYVSGEGESAVEKAVEVAGVIAGNGPLALRAAKQAILNAPELELEAGLDFERACYEPLLKSKDRLEALEAFREKRAPVFKGE